MYTAVLLDYNSAEEIRNIFQETIQFPGEFKTPNYPLPHHMTINMGKFDESLNNIDLLGQEVELLIDGFAYSIALGIAAARVTEIDPKINTINLQPHITTCIMSGVKPFLSNKLDWHNNFVAVNPFKVFGEVTELS